MRLSDAGLRRRPTKLIYPNHRLPPWPTEDVTRDRSNRLLGDLPKRALVQIGVSIGPAWPSMKNDDHAINNGLFEIFTPSNIIGIVLGRH
jgi:hypothetical protein